MVRIRPILAELPGYKPGRPPATVPGQQSYKLSSNENPYPPLPSVVQAITEAVTTVNRYPDANVAQLRDRLGEALGVPADCIATGTGSVALLSHLIETVCDPGDEVLFAWRSFESYPLASRIAGANPVMVALDEQHRHNLDAMAQALTERTRMVLICTPNNPTGTVVHRDELDRFLQACPKDVLVVIDEAYLEFVRDPESPDAVDVWRNHENVAVLRTFSKAYGLAGLRVGYVLAHPELAAAVRKVATPFGVNHLAQVAALASLQASDELSQRVEALVAERARVSSELAAQGWDLPASEANFVFFPLGEATSDFATACDAVGLAVRPYGDDGVRVTIGEPEANDRLIATAKEFRNRNC